MLRIKTTIQKFRQNKEKTGWSYVEISAAQAHKIKPNCKVSFRVKGKIDAHEIAQLALVPAGGGDFILPINGTIRKAIKKEAGDPVSIAIELDEREIKPSSDFMACLKDDDRAYKFFQTLPKGHQNYFSQWINSAKTIETKTKRITMAVIGLAAGQGYGEMVRANKAKKL